MFLNYFFSVGRICFFSLSCVIENVVPLGFGLLMTELQFQDLTLDFEFFKLFRLFLNKQLIS